MERPLQASPCLPSSLHPGPSASLSPAPRRARPSSRCGSHPAGTASSAYRRALTLPPLSQSSRPGGPCPLQPTPLLSFPFAARSLHRPSTLESPDHLPFHPECTPLCPRLRLRLQRLRAAQRVTAEPGSVPPARHPLLLPHFPPLASGLSPGPRSSSLLSEFAPPVQTSVLPCGLSPVPTGCPVGFSNSTRPRQDSPHSP